MLSEMLQPLWFQTALILCGVSWSARHVTFNRLLIISRPRLKRVIPCTKFYVFFCFAHLESVEKSFFFFNGLRGRNKGARWTERERIKERERWKERKRRR